MSLALILKFLCFNANENINFANILFVFIILYNFFNFYRYILKIDLF